MNNENKVIWASFVPLSNKNWFLSYLNKKFKVDKINIEIYKIKENKFEYLIIFPLHTGKDVDLKFLFNNIRPIHKKKGCIFSINGLNKYIEMQTGLEKGNIQYTDYKINWDEMKNKLLLSDGDDLHVYNVEKIKYIKKQDKK